MEMILILLLAIALDVTLGDPPDIIHPVAGMGKVIDVSTGMTTGDQLGSIILTTVTATCIIFEIIGPILTKVALKKAKEID